MQEYQDFDLDRSTAQAWESFTERLAEVVGVMDDTATLTIGLLAASAEGASPYVRFECDADRMITCEAASNAELSELHQLGVADLDLMSELGWRDPNVAGEHPSPGFWIRLPQAAADDIARLAVRTLRNVFGVQHPVFLAPDQLADVLTPRPTPLRDTEFLAEDVVAIIPTDRAQLDQLVESELVQLFGHDPLRDADGDYAIRFGSAMVFVRSTEDAREVLVFSAVVHDVEGRSRAVEVLNDLNSEARYVRFQLVRDRVFVNMSVLAHPFVPAHLHQALRAVAQVADGVDDELATKLHGRTTFPNENPR